MLFVTIAVRIRILMTALRHIGVYQRRVSSKVKKKSFVILTWVHFIKIFHIIEFNFFFLDNKKLFKGKYKKKYSKNFWNLCRWNIKCFIDVIICLSWHIPLTTAELWLDVTSSFEILQMILDNIKSNCMKTLDRNQRFFSQIALIH